MKKIIILTLMILICFVLILFSYKIGLSIADSTINDGIDTEEYFFFANNISQSIRVIAGIIASFILYLTAHSIVNSK